MNRIIISTLSILAVSLVTAQVLQKKPSEKPQEEDLAAQVTVYKKEATKALEPYRYDASKVTYFTFQPYEQTKEVEIFFFNKTEYRLAFNSKGIKENIVVEIYDRAEGQPDRTLLFKKEAAPGGEFTCTSTELTKKFEEGGKKGELKRAFISYRIPSKVKETFKDERSGEESVIRKRGAMVLAMGYSNV